MSIANPRVATDRQPLKLELLLQINVGALVIMGTSLLAMGQRNLLYALVAVVATATAIVVTDMKGYFRLGADATTLAALFACVVLVVQVIRNAEQSQLLNVANILIYLQVILLFQEKQDRTYWSLMALSLLQVVVAAALNLGLIFGLLLVVYVLVAGTALMLFFAVREIRPFVQAAPVDHKRPGDGKPEGEPGAFVGTLLAEPASQVVNRALLKRLGRMMLVTALATVVIFFAIPRYSNSVWQGARQAQVTTVGFTEEVQLDDIGRILESPEQVMRVEFTDLQGQPYRVVGEPYFRGTVLSDYRGRGLWKQRHYVQASSEMSQQTSFDLASTILQRITLQPGSHSVLFNVTPCYPVDESPRNLKLNLYTRQLTLDEEDFETRGSFRYTLGTTGFRNGWQRDLIPALWATAQMVNRDTKDTLAQEQLRLDQPSLVAAADAVIAQLSLQQAGAFERAKALENHFRRSGDYTYSLEVNQRRDRNLDPIEDFVRNHRTGHCEYFAGALTLMLRSQGIPARMVVGYKGGEFNTVGNYYIVRQLHAHAWVEAFLPEDEIPSDERDSPEPLTEGCWLRLDPTPDTADVQDGGEGLAMFTTVREFLDYCEVLWDDYVLGLNSTRQQQAIYRPVLRSLRAAGQNLFGAEVWQTRGRWLLQAWQRLADHRTLGIPTLIPLSIVAVSLVGVGYRRRRQLRQGAARLLRRLRPVTGGRRAGPQLELYRRLEAVLARIGLSRQPAQTPWEFAGAVAPRLAERGVPQTTAELPQRITAAYYRFRFGRQPLGSDEQRRLLEELTELELAMHASRHGAHRQTETAERNDPTSTPCPP